jgi:hypothetical protein
MYRGGHRRRADDGLRAVRRHDRHHLGADHQGHHAAVRRQLHGRRGAVALRLQPRGDVRRSGEDQDRPGRQGRQDAEEAAKAGFSIMGPVQLRQGPDLGHQLRHGADVRHRRSAAHPDALLHRAQRQGSAQVGAVGHHLDRLLLHPDLHHRLWRHHLRADQPQFPRRQGRAAGRQQHGGGAPGQRGGRQRVPGLHLGGGFRHHPGGGGRSDAVGASAVSHDLYATVIKKGKADSAAELRVSKITTIAWASWPWCWALRSRSRTSPSW